MNNTHSRLHIDSLCKRKSCCKDLLAPFELVDWRLGTDLTTDQCLVFILLFQNFEPKVICPILCEHVYSRVRKISEKLPNIKRRVFRYYFLPPFKIGNYYFFFSVLLTQLNKREVLRQLQSRPCVSVLTFLARTRLQWTTPVSRSSVKVRQCAITFFFSLNLFLRSAVSHVSCGLLSLSLTRALPFPF